MQISPVSIIQSKAQPVVRFTGDGDDSLMEKALVAKPDSMAGPKKVLAVLAMSLLGAFGGASFVDYTHDGRLFNDRTVTAGMADEVKKSIKSESDSIGFWSFVGAAGVGYLTLLSLGGKKRKEDE